MTKLKINVDHHEEYSVSETNEGVFLNENLQQYDIKQTEGNKFILYRGLKTFIIRIVKQTNNHLILNINGNNVEVTIKDHITQILEKLGMDLTEDEKIAGINAPMPGTILEVAVKIGDEVKKGDKLIILEAMKMENIIKAPVDGVIKEIKVQSGENVEKNQPLLSF